MHRKKIIVGQNIVINSTYKINMNHFPVTVIDNFFNYPDKVRELALSCEYGSSPSGDWPGLRSPKLHLVDKEFFDKFCLKVLSIFYDTNFHSVNFNIDAYFQKITSLDNNPKSYKNKGWIHHDEKVLGGIIYLTPIIDYKCGTSIFHTNEKFDFNTLAKYSIEKQNFYTHKNENNYNKAFKRCLEMFDETVNVSNVYNRLILLDGKSWHAAQNLFVDNDRLTLVFFVDKIDSTGATPLYRMKKVNI